MKKNGFKYIVFLPPYAVVGVLCQTHQIFFSTATNALLVTLHWDTNAVQIYVLG